MGDAEQHVSPTVFIQEITKALHTGEKESWLTRLRKFFLTVTLHISIKEKADGAMAEAEAVTTMPVAVVAGTMEQVAGGERCTKVLQQHALLLRSLPGEGMAGQTLPRQEGKNLWCGPGGRGTRKG